MVLGIVDGTLCRPSAHDLNHFQLNVHVLTASVDALVGESDPLTWLSFFTAAAASVAAFLAMLRGIMKATLAEGTESTSTAGLGLPFVLATGALIGTEASAFDSFGGE